MSKFWIRQKQLLMLLWSTFNKADTTLGANNLVVLSIMKYLLSLSTKKVTK